MEKEFVLKACSQTNRETAPPSVKHRHARSAKGDANRAAPRVPTALARMAIMLGGASLCASVCAQPSGAENDAFLYRVVRGDTLFGLADRYMDTVTGWHDLQARNHVADPKHLPPGTMIRIPLKRVPVSGGRTLAVFVTGDVRLDGQPLQVGMAIPEGSHVAAGARSSATLQFGDGSRVIVAAQTVVEIKRARVFRKSQLTDTIINLINGETDSRVAPRGTGVGRYEMNTPTMVTGVRGTRFSVSSGQQDSRSSVMEGVVRVRASGGASNVAVPAGHGLLVSRAGGVAQPLALLRAPTLSPMTDPVVGASTAVQWAPVAGATRYRVIVARDDSHTEWLSVQQVATPSAILTDLPEGRLTLVVNAIDGNGFDGIEGVTPMTVVLHPAAPFTLQPANDAKQYGGSPVFGWASVEDADQYDFQLSPDKDFEQVTTEVRIRATTLMSDAAPGQWWWRVRSVNSDGRPGPWSLPVAFEARPVGPAPSMTDDGDSTLHIRWSIGEREGAPPGAGYRAQLARDSAFKDLVLDTTSPRNELTIPRPSAGTYFVRVARADWAQADGDAAFSAAQRIEVVTYVNDANSNAIRSGDGMLRGSE